MPTVRDAKLLQTEDGGRSQHHEVWYLHDVIHFCAKHNAFSRHVTRCKLEFDSVQTKQHFQQIQNSWSALNAFLSNVNSWRNTYAVTDFICIKQIASITITEKLMTH